MRDNLKKANVVLTKDLIDQIDEKKNHHHGSRSQLIRQALAEYFDGNPESDTKLCLKPIRKKLESVGDSIDEIQNELQWFDKKIDAITSREMIRKVSEDIEKLLLEKEEPLSVPDIGEHLPYEQNELLRGVEILEDRFTVVRVEQGKLPKWKIRGN
ncbi:hypothetical protein AKJ51_00135 [candidate division MSBL1 archaeon SCGC-AAA382A20]|uniref:Ribbon-helix-helix protein CopG domain-containing protein n=1 Tax=candidate division MSBL1 archaeon SCGC-AAA382A20 TaxID=1698280 RepID=A0A133VMS6_9EURY|nr:hypothetical protein AKJ51_00135 [candidate division MSBL1 archaeon SCGC-AAA382A20]